MPKYFFKVRISTVEHQRQVLNQESKAVGFHHGSKAHTVWNFWVSVFSLQNAGTENVNMNFKGPEILFIPLTAHFTDFFNNQRLSLFVAFPLNFFFTSTRSYVLNKRMHSYKGNLYLILFWNYKVFQVKCHCYRQVYKWHSMLTRNNVEKKKGRERNNISIIPMMAHI